MKSKSNINFTTYAAIAFYFAMNSNALADSHIAMTVTTQMIDTGQSSNDRGSVIDVDQFLRYNLESEFGRTSRQFHEEACARNLPRFQCPPRAAPTGGVTTVPDNSMQPKIDYQLTDIEIDQASSVVSVGEEIFEANNILLALKPFAYRNCSPTQVTREITNTVNIITGLVSETTTTITSKSTLNATIGLDIGALNLGASGSLENTIVDLTKNTTRETVTTTGSVNYEQTIPPYSVLYGESLKFGFVRLSPISGTVVFDGNFVLGDVPFAGNRPTFRLSDFLTISERTIEIEGRASLMNGSGTGLDNRELVVTFENDPVGCFSTPLDELLAVATLQTMDSANWSSESVQPRIVRVMMSELPKSADDSAYVIENIYQGSRIYVRARSEPAVCIADITLKYDGNEVSRNITATSEMWSDWEIFAASEVTGDYQLSTDANCSRWDSDLLDLEVMYFSSSR